MRNQAAKLVCNLKRRVFYIEANYRQTIQQGEFSFMEDMQLEEIFEIVSLQKELMPEDFDSVIFNDIMKQYKNQSM